MKNPNGVELPAYAKINLYLDVTAREENGYHKIESVMQRVSLCDRVAVSVSREPRTEYFCPLQFAVCSARRAQHRIPRGGVVYGCCRRLRQCPDYAWQADSRRRRHGGRQHGRGGGAARAESLVWVSVWAAPA